ncbi:TetR/AcrR family transcriptional regulator [Nocardiopsis algeriensis]|uniref:AcrR family transcriptional regulator n=1 Tax=Nocardiopsis algeriensis TaxID=1478215 RepID=A0A841IL59_9ACTN|nr:TetR family transcriptional regulator [Nocardiopsis algeriensis]MBB6118792.1 AcrR family transcriptional regulator [Nocardiopsis algeriensis]
METRQRTPARERLTDAAYAEVVSGGWADCRMADVAAAAGVSRQTLYNVFGSKEGLLQAVVVREVGALLDDVMRVLEAEGSNPVHALGRSTVLVLSSAERNPLLRAVVTGDRELLPVLTTRSAPLLDVLVERIAATLRANLPHLEPSLAEAVADVSTRLTVSYTLQPIGLDEAARRVETVVHGMLLGSSPSRQGDTPNGSRR